MVNEQVFWDSLDAAVEYMRSHLDPFSLNRLGELYPEESAMLSVRAGYGDRSGFIQLAPPTVQLCSRQIEQLSDAVLPVYLILAEYWSNPGKLPENEALSLLEKGLPFHTSSTRLHVEAVRISSAILERVSSSGPPTEVQAISRK